MDKPDCVKRHELWNLCEGFIERHKLHYDNAYDIDKWNNNSTELIYDILEIVGEYQYDEE